MKKISFYLSALLISMIAFTSCDDSDDNGGSGEIIEDGVYVMGEATGSDALAAKYKMAAGINEADDQTLRAGMYEKYVALEAGKDFSLLLYTAGDMTYYGATLVEYHLDNTAEEPDTTSSKGDLVVGADAPMMQVAASGLYHIVLDLNTVDDLSAAKIIVTPVLWAVNIGEGGFTNLEASDFNQETMTWTKTFESVDGGTFKYVYGQGWKIQLDETGKVKANTNLGDNDALDGLEPGGADIDFAPGTAVTFTLTWTLKSGAVGNGFVSEVTGDFSSIDPSAEEFLVGVSGDAFGTENVWGTPAGKTLAIYNADASVITDAANNVGSYVFELENLDFEATKNWKARINVALGDASWVGGADLTITGDEANFSGDNDILVAATKTYSKVTITLDWIGYKASKVTYDFTE